MQGPAEDSTAARVGGRGAPGALESLRRRRKAWLALLVAFLACLPFIESVNFGFVSWDDDIGIENNPRWRGISLEHLQWMFTTTTLGHWQPLSWLSFGVEHALWGVRPDRMHALNVALHGCNAALFFLVATRVLGARGRTLAAFLAALFFGLHPLRVETVAWITERAHLLATGFALASVLSWLKRGEGPLSARWRWISIALFALSLMSKAWGIFLPFVLVILDDSSIEPRGTRGRGLRFALRQLREKAAFFLLAAAAVAGELVAKQGEGDFASWGEHGLAARAAQAGGAVHHLLARTLWPVELSPLYEFSPGADPLGVLAAIAAAAVTAVLLFARTRRPGPWRAWLLCLVLLAPVSGIAQFGLQRFADRYTYLAAMPLALAVGVALAHAISLASRPLWRWTWAGFAVLILGVESAASARQVRFWRDSESLWSRVVEVDPNSFVGWHNLATTLHRAGRIADAIEAGRRSVECEPGIQNQDSWFHLGQLEMLMGERERALSAWRTALALDPADLTYLDWLASTQPSAQARESFWALVLEAAPDNAAVASRLMGAR